MLEFKIGDMAVYPAHGVGEIQGVETKEIAGNSQSFYVIRILDNGMKIMIPTDNVACVGLRSIIKKNEAEEVFEILKEREIVVDHQTWNRRYREYNEKIKTGSLYEIAEVLRDLYLLKKEKDLSFGERKMLDTAQTLLVKEISIARKIDEEQIEEEIKRLFRN